ncbi:MAG: putative site-specific modification DNA-methyltransferase, partial [Chthonomonadales bacterium]|nr:putative site-specific modification DNA-methyltransferase [Chthonomonadales bacterium]
MAISSSLVGRSETAPQQNKENLASNAAVRRLTGVYYTPSTAAEFMTDWLVRYDGEHVMEPSFGEGIFLHSVGATATRRGFNRVQVTGIEIDPAALQREGREHSPIREKLCYGDFLGVNPFPVQAVIGNPPYVRLRHLPDEQRQRATETARVVMGHPMEPSGSVWMPFVLHAIRFLEKGGRMALVLPYELTYVRYARPLWNVLRNHFGSLRVIRTHERLFPDILQDVVLLLADEHGGQTDQVQYQAFERVNDLLEDRPVVNTPIIVEDLLQGGRPFLEALLGADLRRLLRTRIANMTLPARDLVTFNIGYVSGDKGFFHPDPATVEKYSLPATSLYPSLTSTRSIRGGGLRTATIEADQMERLFLPGGSAVTQGEQSYIQWGEETEVSQRYKCQVRTPWYIVPGIRTPDVILSVFSERPVLLINDAGCFASNSLLCGFIRGATTEEIATRWYTSLTLLQCELQVHALGGGVMVVIPG